MRINGELRYLWRAVDHEGEVLESFVTKQRDRKAALRFMHKAMKRYVRPEVVVADRLRSTTMLTRNVIFAAAKSSNSIARSPLPNGVKMPLETTGGSILWHAHVPLTVPSVSLHIKEVCFFG